ncbi:unnamed product [Ostreococcus tauri]|uniref:Unnamed product n=1 Tax=Ostreococcus tauri TaxID=70448 RepID=A0A090MCX4_OSTTA|nr:unnamed product [Ostreococcus tauri]CEF99884.1 unnamed product [Ostreococcus tauri]|eukprot:XP_003082321.2 unnamed product [Ostreococcus tauri]
MSRVDGAASACAALVDAGDEDAFRRRARAVLGGTAVGEKDDAWAVRALDGGRWEGKETTVTSVGERMSEKTISRAREEAFERFQQSAEAERAAEAESESESESEDERVDETEDGDEIVKSGALVEAETGESLISIEETTTMTVSSEPASALDPFASFGNITIDPAPAVEPEVVPTTFEEDADDEFGDFV